MGSLSKIIFSSHGGFHVKIIGRNMKTLFFLGLIGLCCILFATIEAEKDMDLSSSLLKRILLLDELAVRWREEAQESESCDTRCHRNCKKAKCDKICKIIC